jgi:hypothetical protein
MRASVESAVAVSVTEFAPLEIWTLFEMLVEAPSLILIVNVLFARLLSKVIFTASPFLIENEGDS